MVAGGIVDYATSHIPLHRSPVSKHYSSWQMLSVGYMVYGGAALMAGAAQAGAAPIAIGIAALTGAGAAASGLAASGVGPAILADGGMGFILPSDSDGKFARY